ncbi:MAG TPA: LysM peptidoglycan-binding domain-containing protein [Lentimicrobium sp.]|nr:LysM peptidoglycan-binding domain-containing protein [Lentimicrobium sp.]
MKRIFAFLLLVLAFSIASEAQEIAVRKSTVIETYKGQRYYIHFVEQGQTLHSIAKAYGVTVDEIRKVNTDARDGLRPEQLLMIPAVSGEPEVPKETVPVVKPLPAAETASGSEAHLPPTHTVLPKDTWYALSRQYKVPVTEIIEANPGIDTLKIGMSVVIPIPAVVTVPERPGMRTHTVEPGETLYGIARFNNVTIDDLTRINPQLSEGLKAGQVIYLPDGAFKPSVQQKPKLPEEYIEHSVERRETLYSISRLYGVGIPEILNANPELEGTLRKNQVLRIPVPGRSKPSESSKGPDSLVLGREVYSEAVLPAGRVPCLPSGPYTKEYKIALLVPFQLEEADTIYTGDPSRLKLPSAYSSLDFIQFYEGALIAADQMAAKGMRIKLHVFDADAGDALHKTHRLINSGELKKMDLIIGPLYARSFETVSDYALTHKIPIVNPLSQRREIVRDNPMVVKIQASGWSRYNGAATVLADSFPNANFVIMRRNETENSSMAEVFLASLRKQLDDTTQVKEVIYSRDHDAGINRSFAANRSNVLLMLTNDKALIPALLRRLNEIRDTYRITIVGLPEWEDMEVDMNYLHNLNAHFFTNWFVDYGNPATVDFITAFRERFTGEPELTRLAYLGFDVTKFFLSALYNYGSGFMNCLPDVRENSLSTDFRFSQENGGGYENTGVTVYRLNNYRREALR